MEDKIDFSRIAKAVLMAGAMNQIRTINFRIKRIKAKGKSRFKSVNNRRNLKIMKLTMQATMGAAQILIINSQPLPKFAKGGNSFSPDDDVVIYKTLSLKDN